MSTCDENVMLFKEKVHENYNFIILASKLDLFKKITFHAVSKIKLKTTQWRRLAYTFHT